MKPTTFACLIVGITALISAGPASGAVRLAEGEYYGGQEASNGIAIADFDGDGANDVAYPISPIQGPGAVVVRLNSGGGSLGSEISTPVNEQPQNLAAGDFNGDGRPDLATVTNNPGQDSLTLLINTGGGNFSVTTVDTTSGPRSVELADMDGDGDLDAVVSGFVGERGAGRPPLAVAVHRNDGSAFGAPQETRVADEGEPTDVATGDFDNNGVLDVAYADFNFGTGGRIYVLLGTGGGNLGAPTTYTGSEATEVVAGDLDRDGDDDVISGGPDPTVFLAQAGTLGSPRSYDVGSATGELGLGDLDDDGNLDIVTAGSGGERVLVNNGEGVFELEPRAFPPGGSSRAYAVGDLNGDGANDVVTASFGVTVYINRGASTPRPRLSGVPRGCAPARFKVRVRFAGAVRSVEVRLDGRRIKRSGRASFSATVRARSRGRHRLQVIVTPESGDKVKKTKRFRRC